MITNLCETPVKVPNNLTAEISRVLNSRLNICEEKGYELLVVDSNQRLTHHLLSIVIRGFQRFAVYIICPPVVNQ